MQLSDEQIKTITTSIDELTEQVSNVDQRLTALCRNLMALSETVKESSIKQ